MDDFYGVPNDLDICPNFYDCTDDVCEKCFFKSSCMEDCNYEIQQKRASSDDVSGNEDH